MFADQDKGPLFNEGARMFAKLRTRLRATHGRNQHGFSLVEILVAAGLVGVVGLGLSSIIAEMAKQQSGANLRTMLLAQRTRFDELVKDDKAWIKTVAANGGASKPMNCLATQSACTANTTVNNLKFILKNSQDITEFDSTTGTSGFTAKGAPCNTFSATTPTAACPISYQMYVFYTCPGGNATCYNPTIEVFAQLVFPDAMQKALGVTVNPTSYSVDRIRGVGTRFDPILLAQVINTTAGNPGAGAGDCTSGGYVTRKLAVQNDPANNIIAVAADGMISMKAGSYSCRLSAPAFRVGTHYVRLRATTGATYQGATALSDSSQYVINSANADVQFVLNVDTDFYFEHWCQSNAIGTPAFHMGFGTGTYGTQTFATMACYRNS